MSSGGPDSRAGALERAEAQLAELRTRLQPVFLQRLAALEAALAEVQSGMLSPATRQRADEESHKLAGSLGTFGMVRGSSLAREVNLQMRSGAPVTPEALGYLVEALREELQGPREHRVSATPMTVAGPPLLLVVDPDSALAARVAAEAEALGLRTQTVRDVGQAREAIASEMPDAVLIDIGAESARALKLVEELAARGVPVSVMSTRDSFEDRLRVAGLGARSFLPKPMGPAMVIEAVRQTVRRGAGLDAKVLVVDDDPVMVLTLRSLLTPAGLTVTAVEEPARFWETLEEVSPDLLILDVNMPGHSGIDLCRVVRNDTRWGSLPILFITAQTDPETVQRVYAAGADDYVSKPIVGPELLTRIANRLERAMLHRSMAETDLLTGVANRRKSIQVLSHFLRLAVRHNQPLALAVLDLDEFKHINDTYGHAAGDTVLRRVGEVLGSSFRGEDVVSRWGGEEFVLGMYGMTAEAAARRLAKVLSTLSQESFTAPEGAVFHASFSAGVAQFPEHGAELQALYRAADRALYGAKAAGRKQVIAAELPTR